MKQLIIARHAKSSWDDMFCDDFDRGLNKRGKEDLKALGILLKEELKKPDLLVASPAKRARKTAFAYAKVWGYDKKRIVLDKSLYDASLEKLLRVVEKTNEKVVRFMLVGHNPGLTDLVNYCGYDLANLPTCGVVIFQYAGKSRENFEPKQCFFYERFFPKEKN